MTYVPRSWNYTGIPSAAELHVVKRFGTGYSRGTLAALRRIGGIDNWFEQQLDPFSIAEPSIVGQLYSWFPALVQRTAAQKAASNESGSKYNWQYGLDLQNLSTLRRMYSNRQIQETMTDFWSNHLHISTGDERVFLHHYDYDKTIRRHALGRFEDLLVACSTHPAMSLYLDNWRSTAWAPNENQGRELLELHTVGLSAGYTETMVKHSARILSGYTVDMDGSYEGYYDPSKHQRGSVQVLDFSDYNSNSDGRGVADQYLRYLANHPATARNVARRMAVRFVSDDPSDALVDGLVDVYSSSGTDIKAMLRYLYHHDEFRSSAGQKVSTPVDDLVATVRAMGAVARRPTPGPVSASFPTALNYAHGGLRLYSWPRPDGAPETNSEWTSAVRMIRSWRMHWQIAGGYYPGRDVFYRRRTAWLPRRAIRFDYFFDHLSRSILGRRSTAASLEAVCYATGLTPATVITYRHPAVGWMFPHITSVLLDSPEHMTR